jgi:AsmA protein
MARALKILLVILAGLVGIVLIAAIAIVLFFDPNDYRDEIAAQVEKATGRKLTIAGELSLDLFPWLAVEMGETTLANAEGFGDGPFMRFERAELSVRVLPLILRRELAVGTASLDSLVLNLAVAKDGRTNWDDLAQPAAEEAEPAPEEGGGLGGLDIANVAVRNAQVNYRDAQAGSAYAVTGLTLETGRIAAGVPFDFDGEFDFTADPGELGGHLAIDGTATLGEDMGSLAVDDFNVTGVLRGVATEPAQVAFAAPAVRVDMNAQTAAVGEMTLEFMDVRASANVEPFSYAGTPQPKAKLEVQPFSLKRLMQAFGTEPPVTADPAALTRVAFNADAAVGETAIALTSLTLKLDDTTLQGRLSVPTVEEGLIEFDLTADSIDVDRYMAPGDAPEAETEEPAQDVEIPVDLIRSLQARGTAKLGRATLAGMLFENIRLGVNSRGGKLRLHPIAAELFEGTYEGDVRIDASGKTPSISVDEKVQGASLTPLVRAMFEQENVSGTIAGSFKLSGKGATLSQIRSDLDGNMAFELKDGAWEGTDVWHQLRTARALFRKEPPPEREGPPRTEFTSVVATGTVTDGLFRNDDLLAELPFLQLTGKGNVDLAEGSVDYQLQARVLEKPEFVDPASEAELADFTQAVIPLKITGPLASPSIRPDLEGMLKAEVQQKVEQKRDEIKERVLNRLLGGDEEEGEQDEEQQDDKKKLEDRLKDLIDQ